MEILVKSLRIEDIKDEALILPVFSDSNSGKCFSHVNNKSDSLVNKVLKSEEFKGELSKIYHFFFTDKIKKIILVGLGKESEFNHEKLRKALGNALRYAKSLKLRSFSLALDNLSLKDEELGESISEALHLSNYNFNEFKTDEKEKNTFIHTITLLYYGKNINSFNKGLESGKIISESVIIARDLVNTPASIKIPAYIASKARDICKKINITCKIFYKKELKEMGMNALLAVNAGSVNEPAFLVMEYSPRNAKDTLVFVGKGITFDSGGLGIKPALGMKEMKGDMAGAAAVIGIVRTAALLKLPIKIVGLAAITENMPGNNAYKPGDIVKALNGKTIEIQHTDAEGRVVLADALSYANKYKPRAIIDLATLTGACVIALGGTIAGAMGTDEGLIRKIFKAGEETSERIWQLPLYEEHSEMVKSDFADVKNLGSWESKAGSLTAGAFLKEFVEKGTSWVHLDIAGTEFYEKDDGILSKGATGFGIRLLTRLLRNW